MGVGGGEGKERKMSSLIPNGGILLRILGRILGWLDQIHINYCLLNNYWGWGTPRVCKKLWKQRVGGVGHAVWNLWLASTNVVFEHTTSVAVGAPPKPSSRPHPWLLCLYWLGTEGGILHLLLP